MEQHLMSAWWIVKKLNIDIKLCNEFLIKCFVCLTESLFTYSLSLFKVSGNHKN